MPEHPELTDDSPMPYGIHNSKPMKRVPAKYLLWMWNDGLKNAIEEKSKRGAVARYIKANMTALQKEDPDTIVEK